jgi:ankyrin repeat protein
LLKIPAVRENAATEKNESLQWAATNGHFKIVRELLKIPAVRDTAAARDNYVLLCAASNGHLECVRELLKIPAVQKNAAARYNDVLRGAAANGHLAIVRELLSIEHVAKQDSLTRDILELPAKHGYVEVVRLLLNTDKVVKNLRKHNFSKLLAAVIAEAQSEVLVILLDNPHFLERLKGGLAGTSQEDKDYRLKLFKNAPAPMVYILAKKLWPDGVKEAPADIRELVKEKFAAAIKRKVAITRQFEQWHSNPANINFPTSDLPRTVATEIDAYLGYDKVFNKLDDGPALVTMFLIDRKKHMDSQDLYSQDLNQAELALARIAAEEALKKPGPKNDKPTSG